MTTVEPRQSKYTGMRMRRTEDPRLLAGRATYIDDVVVPKMIEAAVLRSPFAHARIVSIDVSKAREHPGVFDVITGAELTAVAGQQPVIWFPIPDQRIAKTHALAMDRVRWVGQAVAAVAAVNRYVAEDALELIDVDYEPLPVVADLDAALAPGAPKLYDDWPDNLSGTHNYTAGDPAAAFAEADVVVGASFRHGRAFGCPLEPRGCIVTWDSFADTLDVWLSTQSPNLARDLFGEVFGLPVNRIRVRTPSLGGGFGNKFDFYGEEVIAAVLSRRTGRPVKLIEDRRDSFVATSHSRDQRLDFEMALRSDGTILGLRGVSYGVLGGALGTVGSGPPWASVLTCMGPYKIPNLDLTVKVVMTNRSPYGSYRGWGVPKGNIVHERLIELAARKLGMDRLEIRRKNFPAPEEFPYFSGAAFSYDSGRYADCLDLAVSMVREHGWLDLQRDARAAGRSVGIGYSFHVEPSAYGPSRILNLVGLRHSGFDEVTVRMDSTGRVTVYSGQINMGQGTHTIYAQLAADGLGVPIEDVTVVTGDTESCPYTGYGTGGSRAATLGGAAIIRATERLKAKVLRIGAQLLEAAPEDVDIEAGQIAVRGAPGRSVTTADVGNAAYRNLNGRLPDDETPTLDEADVFDPPNMATSYGCTALLIEVDRETGQVTLLDCLQAHDCGTVINPMLVDGQLAGGLAQALGGALLEELIYDEDGQLRTASFMDYLLPTAMEIPPFHFYHQETVAPDIPGGIKGVGEAGTIAGVSLVGSGIDDALHDLGVAVTQFPVTPPRLLELIRAAGPRREGGVMKPPAVEYVRASDSREAVSLLAEHGQDAKILAGGQSLIPLMSFRLARPTVLVDLNRASGLDYIREDNGHIVIGAMTRQWTLERDPVVRSAVPLLPAALRYIGHVTNRNRGTIGGSLAHADPAAELPALLLGLGGAVVADGPGGSRTIPAESFFLGSFTTAMSYDEVLTAARLPRLPSGTGIAVEELARRHGDFAIVAALAAVHLDVAGRIDLIRLSATGVDTVPVRLHESESLLSGAEPTDAVIAAAAATVAGAVHPMDDVHASAAYRRDMAQIMVSRAVRAAVEQAKRGGA